MERVLAKLELSSEATLVFLVWVVFALIFPAKIGNFDFRHFVEEEGLKLSISRSAPPMAVIEDERLLPVPVEPVQEIVRTRGSLVIVAGQSNAWTRLKHYSQLFEKNHFRKGQVRRLSPMSAVVNLVKFVPSSSDEQRPPQVYAVNFGTESIPKDKKFKNVREEVEQPLVAPSVPRSLPRGEEAPPMVAVAVRPALEADPVSAPAPATVVASPVIVPASNKENVVVTRPPVPTRTVAPAPAMPAPLTPPAPPVQRNLASTDPSRLVTPTKMADVAQTQPKVELPKSQSAADMGFAPNQQPVDAYRISGQVELSGGLVATGSSTKLNIQWQGAGQSREGDVDYSSGQFVVRVPTIETGKIFTRLVDESGTVLGSGEYDVEGSGVTTQQTIQGITLLIEPEEAEIRGQIISAYDVGKILVPVNGGEVFGPASTEAAADGRGIFSLPGLSPNSTFVVEGFAPENWGTRLLTSARRNTTIPVFSMKMMESFFNLVGGDSGNSDYGVIWGQANRKGSPIAGVQVRLNPIEESKPIYFNELRIPDPKLTSTSSNGLFAFARIKPGLQMVSANFENQDLPSTVVSVAASRVSYTEISFKSLTLQGRVYDPLVQTAIPSQVQVIGSSESVNSGQNGFNMKAPSSDSVVFVEANSGPDYYLSRAAVSRSEAKSLDIYAFKKAWIAEKLQKTETIQKPDRGFLIGYVTGPTFHVRLDDPVDPRLAAANAEPQVFYFGANGEIDPARVDGQEGGGLFVMTNLQPGLHTAVIQSDTGEVSTSRLFVSSAGVASVTSLKLSR